MTIDLDDIKTYPKFIFDLERKYQKEIQEANYFDSDGEINSYNFNYKYYDLSQQILEEFLLYMKNCRITGYHISRILNKESILNNGLIAFSKEEHTKVIENLFREVGLEKECKQVLEKCELYWNRNSKNRVGTVHLFSTIRVKEVYTKFANNLGGEIIEYALGEKIYEHPYKILVEKGVPIIVKVCCCFSDVCLYNDIPVMAQFLSVAHNWNHLKKIVPPEFDFYINKSVKREDIVQIESILESKTINN